MPSQPYETVAVYVPSEPVIGLPGRPLISTPSIPAPSIVTFPLTVNVISVGMKCSSLRLPVTGG